MEIKREFSITDAAAFAGLSRTMVEYLCRIRLLRPSMKPPRGRGFKRTYSFGDVVMLRAIKRLIDLGVPVSKLKQSLTRLRSHHPEITPHSIPAALLVTDGKNILFKEGNDALLELSNGQLSFAFVIGLSAIHKDVKRRIAQSVAVEGSRRRRVA